MPAAPTVSIALPVYNGEPYLQQTLDDLLGQSYGDLELVICDNASTDATESVCRAAAAQDRRVRYVRNSANLGALPNANRAFALARGRFIALAGHDDRHHPDFLRRLVGAMEARPDAVLAYGASCVIGPDGEPFAYDAATGTAVGPGGVRVGRDPALERPLPDDPVARFRAVLRCNDVNAPIHGLFRADALRRTLPMELSGSDRYTVARAALQGPFAFVDAPLFGFRIHPGSTAFLTREEWAARETGRADAAPPTLALRTYARYAGAPRGLGLPAATHVRASWTAATASLRPHALRNALVPGPDNYWGLRRWPWQPREAEAPAARPAAPMASHGPRWAWIGGRGDALLPAV